MFSLVLLSSRQILLAGKCISAVQCGEPRCLEPCSAARRGEDLSPPTAEERGPSPGSGERLGHAKTM